MRRLVGLVLCFAAFPFVAVGAPASEGEPTTLLALAAANPPSAPSRVDVVRAALPGLVESIVKLEAPSEAEASAPDDAETPEGELAFDIGPGTSREAQLASEYGMLGAAYSTLGQHEESALAYQRALELTPDRISTWGDIAIELYVLGRDDEADAAFRKAMEQDVEKAMKARELAAFRYLASAQYPDVLALVASTPVPTEFESRQQQYLTLYGALATRAVGGDVGEFLQRRNHEEAGDFSDMNWVDALISFVRERHSERELVQWLSHSGEQEKLCEALYYAGVAKELAGETKSAIAHYRAALGTGVTWFLEYHGAERGLRRLGAGRG